VIAIRNQRVWSRYETAIELLSVLDSTLDKAHSAVSNVAWPQEYGDMRQFYLYMRQAYTLRNAANHALVTASTRLLDSESVDTLHRLVREACYRAYFALHLAVQKVGDVNDAAKYRDIFKEASNKR